MSERISFFAELQRRHVYKVGAAYGVAGWLLVQIATQVFPFFDISNAAVRWVVIAVVAGFVPALVLAWLFDLTPQGVVRTAELQAGVESAATLHQRRGMDRKLNYLLGSLLAVALACLALERGLLRRAGDAGGAADKSIAVLPLVNTSGDPANEYFSDGLSEELIAVLGKVPDLKIIGRSSSFHFKNSSDDSRTIGEKLGVANLLEGSVLKQGARVRIVTELIKAADGSEIWSETYDRDLSDALAVQSEIAEAVAGQLKVKLLGTLVPEAAAPVRTNPEAYNLLLQADYLYQHFTEQDNRKAIGFYQQATQLDPSNALAYAGLANAARTLAAVYLGGAEADANYALARAAAQRALALAPQLSEAHMAMGWVWLTPDFDLAAAESEFRQAVALAPGGAQQKFALAYLLAAQGRLPESEATTRQVQVIDPLAIPPYQNLARLLTVEGRYDEAEAALRKALELQPAASHLYTYLTSLDLLRGDPQAAQRDAAREEPGFWQDYALTLAAQAQGDQVQADAALQRFSSHWAEGGAFQVAAVYGQRRAPQPMFDWLERAYRQHDSGLTQLMVTPFLLPYRGDPRFAALCAKLRITAGGGTASHAG